MCGIAGSSRESMFEILMQANSDKGKFANGIVQLYKKHGHITFKKKHLIDFDKDPILDPKCKYYIGHNQAPTSGKRTFEYDTCHPFFSLNWAIVHNGVLTNEESLRKKVLTNSENEIDSSLIVDLLEKFTATEGTLNVEGQCDVIKQALKKLRGSFALAIVYLPTNAIYIVRQGSVLHYDKKGSFSTVKGDTFELVPEGIVFRLVRNRWTEVGKFRTKSPFVFVK